MAWTKEQQKVIDARDCSILVAAAAGSGKTAVLVERIIQKITDKEHPVDIDRILVVTFTKAAAAQMRDRIRSAIDKRLHENPADENLLRQSSLVHNAKITTIDSFCGYVVRNYFGEIQLDPNFRIADEGEMKLLKMDCMDELFERQFQQKTPEFLALVDAYGGTKNSAAVKDMVLQIYEKAQSAPWPLEWMDELVSTYAVTDGETLLHSPFLQEIVNHVQGLLADAIKEIATLRKLALAPNGPQKWADVLTQDEQMFQTLTECENFATLAAAWKTASFARMSQVKGCDEALTNLVRDGRNNYKKRIKNTMDRYFQVQMEDVMAQNLRILPYARELVTLAQAFSRMLDTRKQKKHIADFSDVEHFALRILVDEETGQTKRVAEEFRRQLDEIMIDEYQDSNLVQETILRAISGEEEGRYNLFMVGDVKQSIYRFRQARPELFMEKYRSFSTEHGPALRVDLHTNFRSRSQVLDFTNDIFAKIMAADLGEVAYDEKAALNYGATEQFGERQENLPMRPEIMLLNVEHNTDASVSEELKSHRLEARMIAQKIQEMKAQMQVLDEETHEPRAVRNSDIVILLRTLKGWGDEFADALSDCGIMAHVESSTGYFSALEVQTVLAMLQVLDNPYQDIPMAAVLKSPMVGLDEEELAEIAVADNGDGFAKTAVRMMAQATEGSLFKFYQWFCELRRQKDLPIHEVMEEVFRHTGYDRYVAALPAGAQRLANLNMLMEKAIDFEKTSYKGLFHFVRYIDQLRKYDVDFGEAATGGEHADVVRIMSIHKSKGLEFPIVFVAGLSKSFNDMDARKTMVLHADLGMGLYEMQANPRIRRDSLVRTEIADRLRRENLGEELRILYVALTRAKEKLVLTGTITKEDTIYQAVGNCISGEPLDYANRVAANSYLDWVLPALVSYDRDRYPIQLVTPEELVITEAQAKAEEVLTYEQEIQKVAAADPALIEQVDAAFGYEYPYAGELDKKIKYSVSELKHRAMEAWEEEEQTSARADFVPVSKEADIYVPYFAAATSSDKKAKSILTKDANAGVNAGALRGTAVHRVMEGLDFARYAEVDAKNPDAVQEFCTQEIERMRRENRLSEEEEAVVLPRKIVAFLQDPIAGRMARAAAAGQLFKEKPFVMQYEDVLVQGIIDAFWLEEDGIVVLDYKTDRVREARELVGRYQTQLELYAQALARAYDRESGSLAVKEKLIYAFKLEEVVKL